MCCYLTLNKIGEFAYEAILYGGTKRTYILPGENLIIESQYSASTLIPIIFNRINHLHIPVSEFYRNDSKALFYKLQEEYPKYDLTMTG